MPHVWNVAVVDGEALALDPMNKINEPIGGIAERKVSSTALLKSFGTTPVVSRTDGGVFSSGTRTVLKPFHTAMSGPLWITASMADTFSEAVHRAHRTFERNTY